MRRLLYLVAYDVCDPARLRQVHHVLKDFACGGQKSAFECYLSSAELSELVERVGHLIDHVEDALLVIRLAATDNVETLGIAVKPADDAFSYLG